MSKCDIRIVPDKTDRTYAAGEPVSGSVQVSVNAACECKGLTISLGWQTVGRGNTTGGVSQQAPVFSGRWQAGEVNSYRFQIPAPPGPFTYNGTLLGVQWHLSARADIPWAIDAKAVETIIVVPGRAPTGPTCSPGETDRISRAEATGAMAAAAIGSVLLAGGIAVLVYALLAMLSVIQTGAGQEFICLILALVGITMGLSLIYSGIRNALSARKLGPIDVSIGATAASPGDTFPITLRMEPRTALNLTGVTATLTGQEVVTRGGGKHRHTYTQTVFSGAVALVPARQVTAGEPVTAQGHITVPPNAPLTFDATDNHLGWRIAVTVGVAGWPDWSREFPLIVRP